MLLVALLLPLRFVDDGNDALWVLLLLPIGLALLHHRPLGWMVELAEKAMKRKLDVQIPPWSASLGLVAALPPGLAADRHRDLVRRRARSTRTSAG